MLLFWIINNVIISEFFVTITHVWNDLPCFQSKSIGDAVYEMLWYNMPSNDSRILLFMMLRCQKRLTITAGKVIDLTLDGFASVRHYTL